MVIDAQLYRDRLRDLRQIMQAHDAAGLFIPSSDPHLSEYLPDRWNGRHFLTGFVGSAGDIVITAEKASLFVDSRYWEIAEAQLKGTGVDLEKVGLSTTPSLSKWLSDHIGEGQSVFVDGCVLSLAAGQTLANDLAKAGIKLVTQLDILDLAWKDRPPIPPTQAFEHPLEYAVRPRSEKLSMVRARMAAKGASHLFTSTLDDIAWLINLRGSDIAFNPYVISHLLLDGETATLFVPNGKLPEAIIATLAQDKIQVADYGAAQTALKDLRPGTTLLIDPRRITIGFHEVVPSTVCLLEDSNPIMLEKSIKSAGEIAGFRQALIEDGVALVRFQSRFESSFAAGENWHEYKVHQELTAERARSHLFVTPSFSTSAGFRANAALPHYTPSEKISDPIVGDGVLLIDSGAQYLTGTTDVTRVWPVGEISDEVRRDATLALKSLIALTTAHFPVGTSGLLLDVIARSPLWAHNIEYRTGTGHGVGYFLGVHEGPQMISRYQVDPNGGMLAGMISTIEPGVYRVGQWGVRHENIVECVAIPDRGFGDFLGFDTLTMCPIDTRCLLPDLLSPEEIDWLNLYHEKVRSTLETRLDGEARAWLHARTEPIGRSLHTSLAK